MTTTPDLNAEADKRVAMMLGSQALSVIRQGVMLEAQAKQIAALMEDNSRLTERVKEGQDSPESVTP